MTAVQISLSRGVDLNKSANFTVSTNAPGTGDIELRYNLLDANSVALTTKDLKLALEGLINALVSGKFFLSTAVGGTNFVGPQI